MSDAATSRRTRLPVEVLTYEDCARSDQPFDRPRRLDVDGRPAVIASEGHVLVVLWDDPGPYEQMTPLRVKWTHRTDYRTIRPEQFAASGPIRGPSGASRQARFDDLIEWAGPVVLEEPCGECDGTGKIDDAYPCEDCEGTGRVYPVLHLGRLAGVTVDRRLLGRALAVVEDAAMVDVCGGRIETGDAVRLETRSWRVVLMSARDRIPIRETPLPTFDRWVQESGCAMNSPPGAKRDDSAGSAPTNASKLSDAGKGAR